MPGPVGLEQYVGPSPAASSGVFLSQWNTENTSAGSSNSYQIALPLEPTGTYDFTVDWGDGSSDRITAHDDSAVTHDYDEPGVYRVAILGTIRGWRFNNDGDRLKLLDVFSWGPLRLGNSGHYFRGCANLDISASDVPDLSGTTNLGSAFRDCTSLTGGLDRWNLSGVTNISNAFRGASVFNGRIDRWNTSAVTEMVNTFNGAAAFNQPIGKATWQNLWLHSENPGDAVWGTNNMAASEPSDEIPPAGRLAARKLIPNTTNTTHYSFQLVDCVAGKTYTMACDVKADELNVVGLRFRDFRSVFQNQIAWFNLSTGTITSSTAENATIEPLGNGWYRISATATAVATDQGQPSIYIGDTHAGSGSNGLHVTGCQFTKTREPLPYQRTTTAPTVTHSSWNTSSVTTMERMFEGATAFNQDLTDWDVSAVTNMTGMFKGAVAFNGDVHSWDTGAVTTFAETFRDCTAFTQDLPAPRASRAVYLHDTDVYASGADIGSGAGGAVTVAFRVRSDAPINAFMVSRRESSGTNEEWFVRLTQGGTRIQVRQFAGDQTYRVRELTDIDLSEWLDVVVTMTDSSIRIAAGGQETVDESAGVGTWNTSGGEFRIGSPARGVPDDTIYLRDVVIAEADLWDQRATILDDPAGAGALVHYPLEEESGTTVYNRLANANHLTWHNADTVLLHVVDRSVGRSWANSEGYTRTDGVIIPRLAGTDMDATGSPATYANGDQTPKWDTSSAITMANMFQGAATFNGDVTEWDTSAVTLMTNMFNGASAFSQPVHNWDFTSVADLTGFMVGTSFSSALDTSNYDQLLKSLASHTTLQAGVRLDMGASKYDGDWQPYWDTLVNTWGWTINDGGVA